MGFTTSVTDEQIMDHSNYDFELSPYILHVTAASLQESKSFDNTMKFLSDKFMKRNNSDNDVWLIGVEIPEGEDETHKM